MPLVFGQALSYSPLLYRPRERWGAVYDALAGAATQPLSALSETAETLDGYAHRINEAFWLAAERVAFSDLDALIVVVADRGRVFDASNAPQIHLYTGDQVWGDAARPELGEAADPVAIRCAGPLAGFLAEELASHGFDVSESSGTFRPAGDPERGAGPALVEPVLRLAVNAACPIVPLHVNCHVDPCIGGARIAPLGQALSRALALVPERVGILTSGGLSGDAGGYMAGWIDDVLDRWVLERLITGRSADLARIYEVESLTLRGSTREVRLWMLVGAAMEHAGARGRLDDYLPFHHAAGGTAFMHWED